MNVSHSGGTTNPRLVGFGNGDLIAVWDDLFASPTASNPVAGLARRAAGEWNAPALVSLPIAGRPSQLLAGAGGLVHGFWIDRRGSLRYASVVATSFAEATAWQSTRLIATSVVAFDAAIDQSGRLHVIYLRAEQTDSAPAGVYYTRSNFGAQEWSFPAPVYRSTYYRRFLERPTDPSQIYTGDEPLPSVEVALGETGSAVEVFLGWNNPALKRIFLLRSTDGGSTWGALQEIDGPNASSPYSEPRQLRVIVGEGGPLLLWQVADTGGGCTLVYSYSADQAESWSPRRAALGESAGCPDGFEYLGSHEGFSIFFLTLQGQASLVAWDGERWSLPQGQQALDYFVDSETYSFVEYGCRQAVLVEARVFVAGCDQGSGGDVWVTERSLESVADWFDPASGWSEVGIAALEPSPALALAVVRDASGALRALWSQENSDNPAQTSSDIYSASLEPSGVSGPFLVLSGLPGRAAPLTAGFDQADRLTAVWGGGVNGELFQSWTSTLEAGSVAGWSDPLPAEGIDPAGREAQLAVGPSGEYFLAYVVPANEGRGVYVAASSDEGQTWVAPGQAFDAASSGCDLVERPSLAIDSTGTLHLAWTCSTLPGGVGPLAVYYSRSADLGETWSPSVRLIDRSSEWSALVALDGSVHLIWQETHGQRTSTWHMLSPDGGQEWEERHFLSATDSAVGPATVLVDGGVRMHLLQTVQVEGAGPVLDYSLWTGQGWSRREALPLRAEQASEIRALAATPTGQGKLGVVYIGPGLRSGIDPRQAELVFASIDSGQAGSGTQSLAVAENLAPTATAEPLPTQMITESAPAATVTPTVAFDADPPGFGEGPLGIVAGILTAAVLIVAVFAFRSRAR